MDFLWTLCSALIVLSYVKCSVGLKTFFFSDLCPFSWQSYTRTVNLGSTQRDYNSSAILKAKDFSFYPTDVTCTVFIEPPPGYGVVAGIRKIDLRPGCHDSLTLTDTLNISTTFCGRKSYSQEKMSVYSTGRLTVTFKTGNSFEGSTAFYDGFQLTVTSFKKYPCSSNFEFECSNLRCVAEELRCDGHNHCGDRSDQFRCGVRSVGGMVGMILGCIFLAAALIAGSVYYRKKRQSRIVTTRTFLNLQLPQHTYPPYGTVNPPYGTMHQPQGVYADPTPGLFSLPQQGFPQPPQQGFPQPPQQGFPQPPQEGFSQPPQQGFSQLPSQAFSQQPAQVPTAPSLQP